MIQQFIFYNNFYFLDVACVYNGVHVIGIVEAIPAQNKEKQQENPGPVLETMVHADFVCFKVWQSHFYHRGKCRLLIFISAICMRRVILPFSMETLLAIPSLFSTTASSRSALWLLILSTKTSKLAGMSAQVTLKSCCSQFIFTKPWFFHRFLSNT